MPWHVRCCRTPRLGTIRQVCPAHADAEPRKPCDLELPVDDERSADEVTDDGFHFRAIAVRIHHGGDDEHRGREQQKQAAHDNRCPFGYAHQIPPHPRMFRG